MKKIVLIGHSGLLGGWVKQSLNDYELICVAHQNNQGEQIDMSILADATIFLNKHRPEIIINLAALADVDLCEKLPQKAYDLNVVINKNIAIYLKQNSASFCIYISTDHLYDSVKMSKESDLNIKNTYALTKKLGEDVLPIEQSVILRTNFFGRSKVAKKSFTDWLFESRNSKQVVTLYTDTYFTPLHGRQLADYIKLIIDNPQYGIFNLGSHGGMSKADFAFEFLSLFGAVGPEFKKVKYTEMPNLTRRPLDMRMDVMLFENTYKIKLPKLTDQISLCKEEYSV